MAACSARASGYIGVVTFDEKPAAALVPGDQVVQRSGSQLSRADLHTVASVDVVGDHVHVVFDRGASRHEYRASTPVVVLPKVQRTGWWEDR
jgi:hypothetical protein